MPDSEIQEHEMLAGGTIPRVLEAIRKTEAGQLRSLLDLVLEEVQHAIPAAWAAIWLFDSSAEDWYIAVSRGLSDDAASVRFPLGSALPCKVGEQGSPLLVEDLQSVGFQRFFDEHYLMHSAMYAPMSIGSQPVGVIAVYSAEEGAFREDDLQLIMQIGSHLGIAIALTGLEEQRHRLSVLQARCRLASDIHDGMLQMLSTIRLLAAEARSRLPTPRLVEQELEQITATTDEAIHELTRAVERLRQSDMYEGVDKVARRMKRRLEASGIKTAISVDVANLLPVVSDLLAAVCREGCNNILKHSDATQAAVELFSFGDRVVLRISDNGGGPKASHPIDGRARLGLHLMRERVLEMHGTVEFSAQERGGSSLECAIPRTV